MKTAANYKSRASRQSIARIIKFTKLMIFESFWKKPQDNQTIFLHDNLREPRKQSEPELIFSRRLQGGGKSGTGKLLLPSTASQVRKSKAAAIILFQRIDCTAIFFVQAFGVKPVCVKLESGGWWCAAIFD
jgi:hypothetical protein